MNNGTMIILRGINNLLHEDAALQFARLHGYQGEVLDVSGEAYDNSPQVRAALARIDKGDVTALYGFSGGGYNVVHIWDHMRPEQRERLNLVVVVGSPGVDRAHFVGPRVIVYNEEGVAHMDQPDDLNEAG